GPSALNFTRWTNFSDVQITFALSDSQFVDLTLTQFWEGLKESKNKTGFKHE
ncbi:hypothetical protein PtrSN002B_012282, partial [Pyrenophora tritici-repentis]